MNQIAIREEDSFELTLRSVESMQRMCAALLKTKHYQVLGEAGIFAVCQKAKSLNIDPLEALNGGLYYLNGKVGMSSEMMASLIRQRGHSIIKDAKSDNSVCILHGRRADNGDTWAVTFSMEDAKRAGLARNMYDKYPGVMLYNRAMSMLARQLFPDVIKGAGYTQEELMEIKCAPVQRVEEPAVVEVISKKQAEELEEVLQECEEEYQRSVMDFIRRPPINVSQLHDLPAHIYDRVMNAAIKKREEARAKEKIAIDEEMHEMVVGE